MANRKSAEPRGDLTSIREKVAELRDLNAQMEDLSALLEEKSKAAWKIEHEELPALMMDAGIDSIGLDAEGNSPAFDAKMVPFYRANIAASWPPEKRKAAFDYLDKIGAGDLIKTEITIALPRESRKQAQQLVAKLSKFSPAVKEAVHTGTLTSWLKEQSQEGKPVELDLIGGEVGTTVKLKPRKD